MSAPSRSDARDDGPVDPASSASLGRYGSPLRFLAAAAGSVFAVEIVVMLLLPLLPAQSPLGTALVDAALLTLLLMPVLYMVVLRPLTREQLQRRVAEVSSQLRGEEIAYDERLLVALGQAAQAVLRARTPDEVYRAIGDEVDRLGYSAVVYRLTDDRAGLVVPHLTFPPTLLRAAEKLAGISAQGFGFPLKSGGLFQQIIAEGEAAFVESTVELTAEALPGPLRPLAGRLDAVLGGKSAIIAPIRAGDEVVGLLAINGTGLSKADVPAVTVFAT